MHQEVLLHFAFVFVRVCLDFVVTIIMRVAAGGLKSSIRMFTFSEVHMRPAARCGEHLRFIIVMLVYVEVTPGS